MNGLSSGGGLAHGHGAGGHSGGIAGMLAAGGIMLTEYNPNYEFGGTCTTQELREIPRENLRLVK